MFENIKNFFKGIKEPPKIFITSDPHFNHRKILNYCPNRAFSNIEAMNQAIKKNWNNVVRKCDTVIVLGDVFFFPRLPESKKFLDSLNGTKILVRGNHDYKHEKMLSLGFAFSCDSMTLMLDNRIIKMSHYPYSNSHIHKNRKLKDDGTSILLHGHTHSLEKVKGRQINVCMDAWDLTPVSLDKIRKLIKGMKRGKCKKGDY